MKEETKLLVSAWLTMVAMTLVMWWLSDGHGFFEFLYLLCYILASILTIGVVWRGCYCLLGLVFKKRKQGGG